MSENTITTSELISALKLAETWLEINRDGVNAINVYPVPDGDTGTNMASLAKCVVQALQEVPDGSGVGDVLRNVAAACLQGGRGNSGTIVPICAMGKVKGTQFGKLHIHTKNPTDVFKTAKSLSAPCGLADLDHLHGGGRCG